MASQHYGALVPSPHVPPYHDTPLVRWPTPSVTVAPVWPRPIPIPWPHAIIMAIVSILSVVIPWMPALSPTLSLSMAPSTSPKAMPHLPLTGPSRWSSSYHPGANALLRSSSYGGSTQSLRKRTAPSLSTTPQASTLLTDTDHTATPAGSGAAVLPLLLPPPPTDSALQLMDSTIPHSPYPEPFRIYLTGFLCRYDPQWSVWWTNGKHSVPTSLIPSYGLSREVRTAFVRWRFRRAVAALATFINTIPPSAFWTALHTQYGAAPGVTLHHLLVLRTLLTPEQQAALPSEQERRSSILDTQDVENHLAKNRLGSDVGLALADGFRPPVLMGPHHTVSDARFRTVPTGSVVSSATVGTFGALDLHNADNMPSPRLSCNLLLLGVAGAVAVMLTGTILMPLDVVKVRQQASKQMIGLWATGHHILETEGPTALLRGWGATMMISFFSGAIIFPGVEVGKLWFTTHLGAEVIQRYRVLTVLATTGFVTAVSSFAMIPWERVKIRAMASTGMVPNCLNAMGHILRTEGLAGAYSGFTTLMVRNLVYMMAKFLVFDYFADAVVAILGRVPTSPLATALLSTVKGMLAGVVSVFVSHPPDAVLTRLSQDASQISLWSAIVDIWVHKGFQGFYAGVAIRAAWAACTVAIQFFIYDSVKALLYRSLLWAVA